jgi:alkylated DNA repair dioxygenase AlkB
MPEIGTLRSTSGEGKRSVAAWPKPPRPSSTLLKEFEFHGFLGKRRVVWFGWHYDFNGGGLERADPMPSFLSPLRDRAADFAGLSPDQLQQVLITEYRSGASIGWHRDRANFEDVIGISLLSACNFRMRRKAGEKWERVSQRLERRSGYVMRGPSRNHWEHSIPAHRALRYSVTFRSLRDAHVSRTHGAKSLD